MYDWLIMCLLQILLLICIISCMNGSSILLLICISPLSLNSIYIYQFTDLYIWSDEYPYICFVLSLYQFTKQSSAYLSVLSASSLYQFIHLSFIYSILCIRFFVESWFLHHFCSSLNSSYICLNLCRYLFIRSGSYGLIHILYICFIFPVSVL